MSKLLFYHVVNSAKSNYDEEHCSSLMGLGVIRLLEYPEDNLVWVKSCVISFQKYFTASP